ncbi:MAG: hypothetical protein D8M57_00210 [Candidatus Scalindua sp. AMX11]|nr:MAG: hypothetical protein DWQ00_18775 [Candidatus Scalindua sp.]NOG84130.1 hypothetical protein [Planctomycetota bacterium]RZV98961.1 MAG: hypothetical protein EX341_00695 [Candidatus Scalindua sp. SCAELEC01]TDE66848.1 MAG: hypothetical protein D8M57_00210 [Candidatus Scalindua sp. AMX11]GJQ57647.1 MAG: hypothetical protein SCALA701_04480 [Candidatus Scalindua sp.]
MIGDYINVINPIVAFSINVAVQLLCIRFVMKGLLRSLFSGFAVGFVSLLLLQVSVTFLGIAFFSNIMVNIIIYSSLGYCYFHFVNLGETARRIRILRELYDSKGGLTLDEILERYNAKRMVDLRLQRLLNNGQVVLKDGILFNGKPVLLLISKTILLMKVIILGQKSEFDK